MLSLSILTPKQCQVEVAKRFRDLRLFRDLTRKTLSAMSGVPEPSIRRFELQGEISLRSLVQLAFALEVEDQLAMLFAKPPAATLDDIERADDRLAHKATRRGRK